MSEIVCQHCPAVIVEDALGLWRTRTTGLTHCQPTTSILHKPMPKIGADK